ncbi:Molybdenum cofactor sulfurase [Candidatus Filomicrobium marinum]|uniref:Molybdenum cofactor sulfurase n=2 Tax=Filomicrobium TaxID=119044 RepID=A0A0D6JCR0_9HYPH|nr:MULTISPECIES: MOSC domain-containing protein [Filomicrobium]CFX12483.1 Molybdenum cofactor sulfurase [Candidatus Filomicrobium marinum]CPR17451.1 Molybdenum cofactor sulfurase [Candidatus Filomicrobium marinum]SDO33873.1 hypothetical protein SAMN04488061_0933 [Filomicrobium insigne]
MDERQAGRVTALYRYPVKGLSAAALERVQLEPGHTLPFDRAWAIENGRGRFDPEDPKWLPKTSFLMLMRDERLATLQSVFEEDSQTLTLLRDGRQVARGALATPLGRQLLEQFFAAYLKASLIGPPKIISAEGHSFSDVAEKCVHVINLATLAELERVMGRELSPLRFRPNVVIDGLAPWQELDLVGKEIRIGSALLIPFAPTDRCAATNVDPENGRRDTSIPAVLQRTWGHANFGIYATVRDGGVVTLGDPVTIG